MKVRIIIILFLTLIWMGFSKSFTLENFVLGALIAGFCNFFFMKQQDFSGYTIRLHYLFLLIIFTIKELFISSLLLCKIILSKKAPSYPHFIKINVSEDLYLTKMILASLISLTPGTLFVRFSSQYKIMIIHSMLEKDVEKVKQFINHQLRPKIKRVFEI